MTSLFRNLLSLSVLVSGFITPGCATMGTEAHMQKPKGTGPVSDTLTEHRSKFEQCIPQSISLNAGESMRMIVTFTLNDNGRVTKAEIERMSSPDPDFGDCILRKLRATRFPPPETDETSRIRYPLIFVQAKQ